MLTLLAAVDRGGRSDSGTQGPTAVWPCARRWVQWWGDGALLRTLCVTNAPSIGVLCGASGVLWPITHSTASGQYIIDSTIQIVDAQTSVVTLEYNLLELNEGQGGTYNLSLSSPPYENVYLALYSTCSLVVPSPTSVFFTPTSWQTPVTITVVTYRDFIDTVRSYGGEGARQK